MSPTEIIGAIVALISAAGGVYVAILRARSRARTSDPPSDKPPRQQLQRPPSHTLVGIGPVTRAEYEAIVHRLVLLEDDRRRVESAMERLDGRIDEETRARMLDQQTTIRDVGLISSRVSEIVGRMDGQAEGSRSRRGR